MNANWNYPSDPFAAPEKKGNKFAGTIVVVCLVILGIFAACNALGTPDDTSSSTVTAPTMTPPTTEALPAQLPATASDGKFTFTVHAVRDEGATVIGDNPYLQAHAQGRFVFVDLTVANTGDRAQTYFPTAQKLLDEQHRKYENDSRAWVNLDQPLLSDINPGNSIQTTLVFDMSAGAVPASITLHDSIFSGGASVPLR